MSIRRILESVLILAMLATPALACLWDRDTLKAEAEGLPGIVDVIVGRFERNPLPYYEMRLERVAEEVERDPSILTHYDDAAVACDRLGRQDEAIAWMARKKAQLDLLPTESEEVKEHTYRYLANLGTFYAHRWFKNGKNREDLTDMETARNLIAQAIALNPDAHFGREEVQLRAIKWIIQPILGNGERTQENTVHAMDCETLGDDGYEFVGTTEGWSGLIVLGAAWESVDVFHVLHERLKADRKTSLAILAQLRMRELEASGKTSIHPNHEWYPPRGGLSLESGEDLIEDYFVKARAAADRWHEHRTQFMLRKLKAGEHPDTHDDFWNGYQPIPPHPMPNRVVNFVAVNPPIKFVFQIAASVIVVYLVLRFLSAIARGKSRKKTSAGPPITPQM